MDEKAMLETLPSGGEMLRATSARKQIAEVIVLVLSFLAVAHFVIGLFFTLRLAFSLDSPAVMVWFSLPYVGIAAIFITSLFLVLAKRLRWSAIMLVLGLLVSVGAFVYDFQNGRYQFIGTGHGPTFTIWWCYYEPFWYGYQPGNI